MRKYCIHFVITFLFILSSNGLFAQKGQNVDSLFKRAQTLELRGNFSFALKLYFEILKIQPLNVSAHANIARLYINSGDTTKAIISMEQVLNYTADISEKKATQILLAKAYVQKGQYSGNKQLEKAVKIYDSLISEYPEESGTYYLELVNCYSFLNKDAAARRSLKQAEGNLGKTNEAVLLAKVQMFSNLKLYKAALKHAQIICQNFPENPDYFILLYQLHIYTHQYQVLDSIVQQALKLFPKNKDILRLGFEHYIIGDQYKCKKGIELILNEKSISFKDKIDMLSTIIYNRSESNKASQLFNLPFQKWISENPNQIEGRLFYARKIIEDGREDEGVALINDVISKFPKSIEAWSSMFNTLLSIGNEDSFNLYIQKSRIALPNNYLPYFYSALAYSKENDHNAVIKQLTAGLSFTKSETELVQFGFLSMIGNAYLSMDDKENALNYYKKAAKFNIVDVIYLNNYSYLLAETNYNLEQAEQMIVEATDYHPEEGIYWDTYGWILFKQGKYEEARIQLLKAKEMVSFKRCYLHLSELESALGNTEKSKEYAKNAALLSE